MYLPVSADERLASSIENYKIRNNINLYRIAGDFKGIKFSKIAQFLVIGGF